MTKLSRDQARALALAGTVSVPQTFPELGVLRLHPAALDAGYVGNEPSDLLEVEQRVSPKVAITRLFRLQDVAAVFVPPETETVDLSVGQWLLGAEIPTVKHLSPNGPSGVYGIAYVREQAPSLLRMEAGMTAAESAEYYPPLPSDRSHNHYHFGNPDPSPASAAAESFGAAEWGVQSGDPCP